MHICDWLWENPPVTHKDNYLEKRINNYLNNSKRNISRKLKAAGLQFATYRIRQNIRGGKLSRFSRILAKRESFTIESFPSSQLENFIIIP